MPVLVQLPSAVEPLATWRKPKSRQASAALPLGELPKYRILAPLFSFIVAVNVQLKAEAVFGTSHRPKSKETNKNFELRPRIHLESQFGITKCPFPRLATSKLPNRTCAPYLRRLSPRVNRAALCLRHPPRNSCRCVFPETQPKVWSVSKQDNEERPLRVIRVDPCRALPQKKIKRWHKVTNLQLTTLPTLPSSTQSYSDLFARYESRPQLRCRRNSDARGEVARARTVP